MVEGQTGSKTLDLILNGNNLLFSSINSILPHLYPRVEHVGTCRSQRVLVTIVVRLKGRSYDSIN